MNLRFHPLATLAVASALPLLAAAQSDTTSTLPGVTISGKAPRRDLAPESPYNAFRTPDSASANTQTISREQIEDLRPVDVFELLNTATGVISTQGSRKGFSGLMVRGDSNFRWIVDGALLQPTMAARMLRSLPVIAIEEVKIVRGGSALTLGPMVGSASPGGAPVDGFIVIRTRKPAGNEAQVRAAAESQGGTQVGAWLGRSLGESDTKGYVAGVVSHSETDGPKDLLDNGATYNTARESSSGLVKGGLSVGGWNLGLTAYREDGSFQIPNASSHGTGQGNWYMDPASSTVVGAEASRGWDAHNVTLLSLSRTRSTQTFWTAATASAVHTAVQNDNSVESLGLRHHIDLDGYRAAFGFDRMHWNAPNGQQYYEGIQREETTRGWFAQIEKRLLQDRLTVDAAYRRDRVHVLHGLDYYIGGAQPPGGVNTPLRTTDKMQSPATFMSAGAAWLWSETTRLTARYGQAHQASDALNPAPGVVFDSDKQQKWELGAEGEFGPHFNPSINWFHRSVKNEKSVAGYTYRATNGSTQTCRPGAVPAAGALSLAAGAIPAPCYGQADTTRGGFELASHGALSSQGSYRASLTHFTQLSSSIELTTPRDIADLSISQALGRSQLTAALKHVSAYRGGAADAEPFLGHYTRLDLGLGYDLRLANVPVRTTIYGRNLTDKRYESSNGVQDVGRVVGVELVANF